MKDKIVINSKKIYFEFKNNNIEIDGVNYNIEAIEKNNRGMILNINGNKYFVFLSENHVVVDGEDFIIDRKNRVSQAVSENSMLSPMPGKILKILVKAGDKVLKGTPLLIIEAMKMEHTILSVKNAIVDKILFSIGDSIEEGVELILLKDL